MFESRRKFLKSALKSTAALGVVGASRALFPSWTPQLAFADAGQARGDVLVNVFLRGGMDGLSAVAPYFEAEHFFDARPTLATPEPGRGGSLDLDGRFALHSALTPLKELYDDGTFGIVHATGLVNSTRSHFDAMRFMETGRPGDKGADTGWLGRHLKTAAWHNDSPFRAVGMGGTVAESLRGPVSPLALRSIADFHFRGRESELQRLQASLSSLYSLDAPRTPLDTQAGLVFETIQLLQDMDANNYQPAAGADYPEGEFGLGLKQVAQLIKAEVGLEVACLDLGGWDTHESQGTLEGRFNRLLTELAQGLHAFYTDLGDRMNSVTVVTMSEFGRRVKENASAGTDHGHGNVMFLLGGGTLGGQVFSDWPGLAPDALVDGDLAITTDYRDVLAEVVAGRLGNPALADIFPGHSVSPLGLVRPRDFGTRDFGVNGARNFNARESA